LELLLCQPRPTGPRTAVFSTSPEASSAAMAALDDANLLPAEVTQHTEMRTRLVVPGATHTGWLVTVPPTSDIAQMALGMATLAEDPGVDAIVCVADAPTPEASRQVADMLDRLSADHPEMTLVSAAALTPGQPDAGNRVPTVPGIDRAMRAVANVRIA
jgi:acyl-CoA synthetase (NDP forming)